MSIPEDAGRFDLQWCRRQFPALRRRDGDRQVVFFDGPAGSQVPERVIEAVSRYLRETNANHAGVFATSRQSDAVLRAAHDAVADFLGADEADCVIFGPNMTTLTFALSRALARTWSPGDEVIVTQLDHDANVSPWVLAARDAGAVVEHAEICPADCTLDLKDLAARISSRTKLVAVTCASNAVGTIPPIREIVALAHDAGALVFLDAVHYAPHRLIDVCQWDCDFLTCSAYKFFGPHVGVLWGRRELLEQLPAYKVRPAPEQLPGRWMTGTQNHEGIAGVAAAIDYLTELGRVATANGRKESNTGGEANRSPASDRGSGSGHCSGRRRDLQAAYAAIGAYERRLVARLLAGLEQLPEVRIWGITDPARFDERVPTVAITHARRTPRQLAELLDQQGIFTWHGNFYALPLTEALGLEPEGVLRIGLLHYNTEEEVDRLLAALREAV